MLSSVEIKNFKAINKPGGLKLDNLAQVNYLVGENGSGKSSVGETIYLLMNNTDYLFDDDVENNSYSYYEVNKDYFTSNSLYYIENIERFTYPEYFKVIFSTFHDSEFEINFVLSPTGYTINDSRGVMVNGLNGCQILSGKKNFFVDNYDNLNPVFKHKIEIILNKFLSLSVSVSIIDSKNLAFNDKILDFNSLSSGIKYILNIITEIFYSKSLHRTVGRCYDPEEIKIAPDTSNENIIDLISSPLIIIDEPESFLHPKFQKKVPEILNFLSIEFAFSFLISTHSPFIISAAASLSEQKVYLIDGGQTVGLDFDPENKENYNNYGSGSDGFEGYEMKEVANKMLGASTSDILYKKYIICEGSDDKINCDANIYNKIFQPKINVKFLSEGGFGDVGKKLKQSLVLNKIFNEEIEIFGFFDGDIDEKIGVIKELKDLKFPFKRTKFTELESYLYHPTVITKFNIDFKSSIEIPAENIKTGEDKHMDSFFDSKVKNKIDLAKPDFELKLAEIIKDLGKEPQDEDNPNIYWQLHSCIFGE